MELSVFQNVETGREKTMKNVMMETLKMTMDAQKIVA